MVEDKGFYHCFGCGAHGTAIDFVMAIEGLAFPEALERLADLTGIAGTAPRRGSRGPSPTRGSTPPTPPPPLGFRRSSPAPAGKEALAYLERRGLGRETVRGFELGYAPNERDRAAPRRSWPRASREDELLAAGVLAQAEGGDEAFDRFRHRIMFPIADERGRIVGFGGRALGDAAREIPEHARDRALPQGRAALQPAPGGQARRASGARWCWPRATWT